MSIVAIDWSAVAKTTLLVLSPGASVLVLLAVEYFKVLLVSWVVLLRNRGVAVVAETDVSPSPKRRGRSSSRGRRGRSASVGRPLEADSAAASAPSPRRRSAARVKRFVTSSIDLLVHVTSFLVLVHMLHLMGEEIFEMITENTTTPTTSSILQIISSKMVIIAAIGAIKGFAVVGILLLEDGSDGALVSSSSPRRTSHHSAPALSPVRRLLRSVQQYGLVIAMALHTLSEGVAAALVDSRATAHNQASSTSTASLLTPYFLALIAHNVCEGLVVAASVKSKASSSPSASGSWKKRKLPSWFISAAIQSITAHIAQPLAYGATALFVGSSLAANLQAAIGTDSIMMSLLPMEAVPLLVSSFALGSLLGAVVFEVAPSVVSALSVTLHNL